MEWRITDRIERVRLSGGGRQKLGREEKRRSRQRTGLKGERTILGEEREGGEPSEASGGGDR